MATPAQLQAQAVLLEQQIARLTQQISAADTPPQQQQALIIQRSQLQNDLVVVQQETTALTQESNPPDPQVPAATAEPQVVQSAVAEPVTDPDFRPQQSTITGAQVVNDPTNIDPAQDPGAASPFGGAAFSDAAARTAQRDPVDPAADPGVRSPFGGGAFNTAAAQTPEAIEQNLVAANQAAVKQKAQAQQALQARFNQPSNGDWRVRIRLAPESNYLYNDTDPGILAPLKASDGVIFPYTPSIQTTYNANYDVTDLTHSNYRGQFYKNSSVGDINITGTFTAQDTAEAAYMLAVIHFFRSVTKMFYGQDPQRGAPPPLVYLFGLGQYQFNNHPCVVRSFNYSLPTDVDYIRTQPNNYGLNLLNRRTKTQNAPANTIASVVGRLSNARDLLGNILKKGALSGLGRSPAGQPGVAQQAVYNTSNATYVPTKIEIQLTLLPIQTRNQVSQQFSLAGFAKGDLLRGGFW